MIEKCLNKALAEEQRKTELGRGWGTMGTISYEQTGCYECDGFNEDCDRYLAQKGGKYYGKSTKDLHPAV